MELNSKKLARTSNLIYYAISLVLCVFLILLSSKIIDDLDMATTQPEYEEFTSSESLKKLERELAVIDSDRENLWSKQNITENTIATARENYENEKQSFDNWVQTRKTLGSPDKDQEVVSRAKRLDEYYAVAQAWREKLNNQQAEIDQLNQKGQIINEQIYEEQAIAQESHNRAMKQYELRVFVIRLLFVAPILAIGIFFFVRYRRHKFWPLFFGFSLFSVYAFFFGLVPYLPSYGGYIRYAVGILLSIGLGYYAIRTIRRYLDQKQAELKISSEERAKNVQSEVAEKALENHFCPSCGKDFLIKKWDTPPKSEPTDVYKLVTDFCRHCGLELFRNCADCGNKNFAHLPFCASCGTKQVSS